MIGWFSKRARSKRTVRYLEKYPNDEPAVQIILIGLELGAVSAREAAEMGAGREISDEEWSKFGERWERAWASIA